MAKLITLGIYVISAIVSPASISFFDNEADWLATAGASASDVSSQTYDGATGAVDNTYSTSGGTGGVVAYTLATVASRTVNFSTDDDFRTGTTGEGIRFTTLSGTGGSGVDSATMTITSGDVFSFSFNVHDLFDTNDGEYGFKVDIQLAGGSNQTVFDTGNTVVGVGGNQSGSVSYTDPDGATGNLIFGDDSIANVGQDGVFFGFTSTSLIESITLTKTTQDDENDNWGFDEFNVVSTAAIPEPSSIFLSLLGGMLCLSRRNRPS